MEEKLNKSKYILVGNSLSIDFVNTLIAENGMPKDLLENLGDFVGWATVCGLIDKSEASDILDNPREKGSEEKTLNEAKEFRKILLEVFKAITKKKSVKQVLIEEINNYLKENQGYTKLVQNENEFSLIGDFKIETAKQILVLIAKSIAGLLSEGDLSFIRKCESKECVLYFYDTTKNHRRRWCSNSACGNRAKAAAFYRRRKIKNNLN